MSNSVYLTSRLFNDTAMMFRRALAKELSSRNIKVIEDNSFPLKRIFRSRKNCGIAIAIDFFDDGKEGSGIKLNKGCTTISRDFAYTISNELDKIAPQLRWRDFEFISAIDKNWRNYFHNVGGEVKVIFYLCTINNEEDFDIFSTHFNDMVKVFADEIVRCIRSNYKSLVYQKKLRTKLRK